MADEAQTVRSIHWRELFPFVNLFRAFRIAIQPSKLFLGLVMVLLLYAAGRFMDACWMSRYYPNRGEISLYTSYLWNQVRSPTFETERDNQRRLNVNNYADMLQQAGLATNHEQAIEAASEGKYFGELESKIVSSRNGQMSKADSDLNDAEKRANQIEDRRERQWQLSQARESRETSIRRAREEGLADIEQLSSLRPQPIFDEFLNYEVRQFHNVVDASLSMNWLGGLNSQRATPGIDFTRGQILDPANASASLRSASRASGSISVIQAISNFAVVGPGWLVRYHPWYFIIYMAWFLLMWAIFGGAIARIAAVHFARDEKIAVRQALRFSFSKVLSFIFAPLIPLIIVLIAGVVLAAGGCLMYVPVIGPIAVAALFVFALIGGAIMTLVIIATAGGINLMYPTIAVEGSDSFDAISRSFSYVFAKPWRMVFYTVVSLVYGAITFLFCRYVVYVTLSLTHFFVGWWLHGQPRQYWPEILPPFSDENLAYHLTFPALAFSEKIAAFLISIWVYIVLGLLAGYVVSFYFSANSIIYYLMRREVDLTELDDVYLEETEDEFGDLASARATPAVESVTMTGDVTVTDPRPLDAGPTTPPAT